MIDSLFYARCSDVHTIDINEPKFCDILLPIPVHINKMGLFKILVHLLPSTQYPQVYVCCTMLGVQMRDDISGKSRT